MHFDTVSRDMDLNQTKMATTTALVFSFLVSFHVFLYYINPKSCWFWLATYTSVLPLAGVLLTAALLVVAARATLMTWIAVLVLLAFSGRRRVVLVGQGRKITADVAMYLVKAFFRGKGLAAVVCASLVSFLLLIF